MGLFNLKKPAGPKELISISYKPSGVCMASVRWEPGSDEPTLLVGEFVPCPDPDPGSYESALEHIIKEYSLYDKQCAYVLNQDDYELFLLDKPDVGKDDLQTALLSEIREYLDYPVEEAVIQISELEDISKIFVVVAKSLTITNIIDSINHTDLELVSIDIPEFSYRNLIFCSRYKENPVGFVNISAEETHLTVMEDGLFYMSRYFPMGYEFISEAGAENEAGSLNKSNCEELVLEIQRSMDYCVSEFNIHSPTHIIFAPMIVTFQDEIDNYMNDCLSQEIIQFNYKDFMSSIEDLDMQVQQQCLVNMGGALRYVE